MFYLDTENNYHYIESTSSKNVALIEKYLTKFNEVQNQRGVSENEINSLLTEIARLAKVETKLILADPEGVLNAIATVNFSVRKAVDSDEAKSQKPKTKSQGEEVVSLYDYHYQLVASLVNTELAVDLASALKISNTTPYKDVEGYIAARIKFLNRDPEKEQQEKAGSELIQELTDGSFFGEVKPDGRDGFRDGVFQAMGIAPPKPQPLKPEKEDMPDSVKQALGL